MDKQDGLWLDLNPVQQFLYFKGTWSNFFYADKLNDKYKLIKGTGVEPSNAAFIQISGGALVKW